ncbi:MAG: cation:proton antiporter [Candidatus Omnitrophica bacterium]|nr:cation:proton antiporter [Candidatus Omnitrophota bacterium]
MSGILIVGIVLFVGFVLGQEFKRLKFPKIVGYILAGVLLNPNICRFVPKNIASQTDIIENIAIAFIAFAVGGTIVFSEVKKLGKGIAYITLLEAETTFLFIVGGFLIVLPFVVHTPGATWLATFIPISLILGCLGSPTDPSVALAVSHEYNTKGEVTSTMLTVAAFDDVLGIINFSVAMVIARAMITHASFNAYNALLAPFLIIAGSVVLGAVMGTAFNLITKRLKEKTQGTLFVLILSFLTLCWGLATLVHAEEILSIMIMAIVVANFNPHSKDIFAMLERYSEELIFLVFFTLSGMHLSFSGAWVAVILLVFFIVFRIAGKFTGTALGAAAAKSSPKIKKYTASALIPFGGIVIGLALIMQQDPAFSKISTFIVNTIVGATIINELIGPIFVKKALKESGEMSK